MLPYSDNMTFAERWYNTLVGFYDWFIRYLYYLPNEKNFAKKHFAHLAPLPPLEELINNVSLTMVNSHRAITPPRPSMPSNRNISHTRNPNGKTNLAHFFFLQIFLDIISIGGAHIKAPKPLPPAIKAFLDGAEHGVIYFSFGSIVKSSQLPKELIQAFFGEF